MVFGKWDHELREIVFGKWDLGNSKGKKGI
jgi:hypothetical protein